MDPYLATALSYAPWIVGLVLLFTFPLGRRILGWWVKLSLALIFLLWISEPDLRD